MTWFKVFEPDGSEVNLKEIVKEEWAERLYDPECFAIDEEGHLMLVDACGNVAYPKGSRFHVHFHLSP
jgi:hypothetical protein